jgi:outer membrane biosynthesis protein TonB
VLAAGFVVAAFAWAFVLPFTGDAPTAVEADSANFAAFDERSSELSLPGQNKKTDKEAPKSKKSDPEADGPSEKAESIKEEAEKPDPKPQPKPKPKVKKVDWKPAVLEVVTNFDKADVTVNGIPYPEYTAPGDATGVVLPAGGPYWVEVNADGNTKTYRVYLRPNETRLLLVDLTGFNGKRPAPSKPSVPEPKKVKADDKEEEGPGKVTVYSKPPGTIMVDGEKKSDKTPGTLEVENGRHEIQVEYDGGGVSEKKIVRVREGSRIKLFFRKRD